jgi:hypothetical protein
MSTHPDVLAAAVSAAHHIHGRPLGNGMEDRSEVQRQIMAATGISWGELDRGIGMAPFDVPPLDSGSQDPYDYLRELTARYAEGESR